MRTLGLILTALWLAATPAKAQDDEIRSVITQQLQAFQVDDFETAFTFASPMIQSIFRNPQRFGQMVRNGYPMVWRPADVQFGRIETRSGRTVQIVYFTDQAGRMFEAEYEMIQSGEAWEINGVAIREADLGA